MVPSFIQADLKMKNSRTAAVIGSSQFLRNALTASRLVMGDLLQNLLVTLVSFIHDRVNIFTLDIAFMAAGYNNSGFVFHRVIPPEITFFSLRKGVGLFNVMSSQVILWIKAH